MLTRIIFLKFTAFFSIFAVTALFVTWIFYDYFWPKLSFYKQEVMMRYPKYSDSMAEIVKHIQSKTFFNEVKKIDYIRNWININSMHLVDEEHDIYAFSVPVVLNKLQKFSVDKMAKPHLSCGPRAYAMKEILDEFGIKSRIIDIFAISNKEVNSHTLVEAFDSEHEQWILQDPDFNVAYVDKKSRRNLSAFEALSRNSVDIDYEDNGDRVDNPLNLSNTISGLFNTAVLYRHSYVGRRSIVVINKNVDVDSITVEFNGVSTSFREYLIDRDFDPKIIDFHSTNETILNTKRRS